MNGLKLDPGWRHACVTWLNLFFSKSNPPTKARMPPSRGSIATKAPSTSGSCVISQIFLGVLVTRTKAPGRNLILGCALSDRPDCTGCKPSPVISSVSPLRRTARTFLGVASITTAASKSPLSPCSIKASSMASSSSEGLAGKLMKRSGPR